MKDQFDCYQLNPAFLKRVSIETFFQYQCISILTVPRPLAHPTIEPAVPGSLINITVITLRMSIMSLLYTVNTFYNNYLIMFIMQHVKDYLHSFAQYLLGLEIVFIVILCPCHDHQQTRQQKDKAFHPMWHGSLYLKR